MKTSGWLGLAVTASLPPVSGELNLQMRSLASGLWGVPEVIKLGVAQRIMKKIDNVLGNQSS